MDECKGTAARRSAEPSETRRTELGRSRQAKRLKKRYNAGGTKALVHGNVGRASNRADDKRREQVLELVRENYSGELHERFGPTLASEHLAADHSLAVPRETLRACGAAVASANRIAPGANAKRTSAS